MSRSLVVGTYEQLIAEGYLEARQGSGTRVRASAAKGRRSPDHGDGRAMDPVNGPYWPLPSASDGTRIPGIGVPDPALFPRTEWLRHYRDVLRQTPASSLLYPPPRGDLGLRAALAGYLGRVRGVRTTADDVVICSGFSQALALLCRVLARRGVRRIAVEDPCFRLHRLIVQEAGLEAVPVRVSPEGLEVSRLSDFGQLGAVVLSPAHSFPSGGVLSANRRFALLAWARDTGGLVIEDDYDAELRYDRTPVGAMQGMDPAHVAYAGSVSKVLSPALRLGWIVLPRHLTEAVIRAQLMENFGTESFGQLTLARFIDSGGFARHLRRVRPVYRARRDALVRALHRDLPGIPVRGEVAGLHLMLPMPTRSHPGAAAEVGIRCGLQIEDASAHWADPADAPPALLIGYGMARESALIRGIEALGSYVSGDA